jgi:hypothetical protein
MTQQWLYFACEHFPHFLVTVSCTTFLLSRLFRSYFVHLDTVLMLYIVLIGFYYDVCVFDVISF